MSAWQGTAQWLNAIMCASELGLCTRGIGRADGTRGIPRAVQKMLQCDTLANCPRIPLQWECFLIRTFWNSAAYQSRSSIFDGLQKPHQSAFSINLVRVRRSTLERGVNWREHLQRNRRCEGPAFSFAISDAIFYVRGACRREALRQSMGEFART